MIAFCMRQGPFPDITPNLLGDVVISADTAYREAQSAGISMPNRFDQLLIHGILHLLGFDHEKNEAEALKMEKRAEELFKEIKAKD